MFGKLIFLLLVALTAFLGIKINSILQPADLPEFENTWWGHGPEKKDDSINEFKIRVPAQVSSCVLN